MESVCRAIRHGSLRGGKKTLNNWIDLGLWKANPKCQGSEKIEGGSKNIIEMIDLGLQNC